MGSGLRLYPAPRADEFVDSAARVYSIPRGMILAGNGSDELLAMLFRATLGSGDTVAYAVPTYSLYDTLALVQEARILHFPIAADFELPLDELAAARANLTIVCSPNSPSGTLVSRRKLATLAKRLGSRLLVIDEAYVDFADENALSLVRRHRNVVVLRTLSKSYSLAGMRLGLCFAHPAVIDALMKVKDSYNLSRVALAAGAEALRDSAWMQRNVEKVRRTRERTESRLRALGFEVPPSQANFVLARIAGRDMAPTVRGLRRAGILVRHFPTPILRDALRISIGTPAEMAALFKALAPLVRATPPRRRGRAGGR
jgi:histidinol-phosphate aminotransferase